jgi:hypothetical protein
VAFILCYSVTELITGTYHTGHFQHGRVFMAGRSKEDPRTVRNRLIWEDASAWIGRIFATMLFMIGPGAGGLWLDKRLGTNFLAAIGMVIGMVLGTAALLALVNVKRPTLEDEVDRRLDGNQTDRDDDDAHKA